MCESEKVNSVIIGNGKSRLNFDLQILHNKFYTYGCNQIYKHLIPNYIICVDYPMIDEVCNNVIDHSKVYTQDYKINNKYVEKYGVKHLPNCYGDSLDSGNWAVLLAATHNHKKIYIVGFDYHNGSWNHVYTHNYNSQPLDKDWTWQKRLKKIIERYKDIEFIRVVGSNVTLVEKYKLPNYTEITIEQFKEILC